MPKFSLDIPDDIADALRLPPNEAEQEVRKELAITLYARQLLPLGKARKLSGLSRRDFTDPCTSVYPFFRVGGGPCST